MSAAVAPELPKEEGREEERGGRRRKKRGDGKEMEGGKLETGS